MSQSENQVLAPEEDFTEIVVMTPTAKPPPKWRCPKCGSNERDGGFLTLTFGWPVSVKPSVNYCLTCFSDWVGQHVPLMERVPHEAKERQCAGD